MSITVETCGRAYCEHYPDGLFVCAKCREESTIAHDKACAKIAEAQADADHWKGECDALQRMVYEARAEIEIKDKLIEQMREALNVLVASATPSGPLWHGSAEMQIARAALLAAERGE